MFSCQQTDNSEDNREKQDADDEPLAWAPDRSTQRRPCSGWMLGVNDHHDKHRQPDGKRMNPGLGNELIRIGQYAQQPVAHKTACQPHEVSADNIAWLSGETVWQGKYDKGRRAQRGDNNLFPLFQKNQHTKQRHRGQ